jgi:hypothetical protein
MSPIKETNFLAYNPADPKHREAKQDFPVKTQHHYELLFTDAKEEQAVGEASPSYLYSDYAIQRIKDLIPNSKFIVSLRNPVDRSYSEYTMALRNGRGPGNLPGAFRPDAYWVQNSFYVDRLTKYFEAFGRERIKVFLFDDLQADAGSVARALFEFLGVNSEFKPNIAYRHNPGGLPKSGFYHHAYKALRRNRLVQAIVPQDVKRLAVRLRDKNLVAAPMLPADVRVQWVKFFQSEVLALEELIGRDLSSWLEPTANLDIRTQKGGQLLR